MLFEIDDSVSRRASTPHELSLLNLAVFHLLAAPASIALNIGFLGFLVPLVLSLSFITFVWLHARRAKRNAPWFVAIHWRLAAYRTVVLLIGYLVTAMILAFAFIVSARSSRGDIMLVAISRIAVVPILATVLISFVLGTTAVAQARRGEVPDSLARKFPPPANLVVIEGL